MPGYQTLDEIRRAYLLLGVPTTASAEEIRQRYLRLAQEWHPDKCSGEPAAQWHATEKMKRLNEAYSRIKDAPLRTEPPGGASQVDPRSRPDPFVVVIASPARTASRFVAGGLGIGLGLYAFGDSVLALLGVSLIRDSGVRLDDVRDLARHARADAAYGWQSWIVSFGDAAERVLALRALLGIVVAYAGLATLRNQPWARVVLGTACAVGVMCGVIGAWSLLRRGWDHTTVPIEAVLVGAVAAYMLRSLLIDRERRP